MKDSKLISLLRHLDRSEQNAFRNYLKSPYFNKKEEVVLLAEFLLKRFVASEKGASDEEVFAVVFPGKPYQFSKLNNLKTALQNQLLNFFRQRVFESDQGYQAISLLRKLLRAGDEKYFNSFYAKGQDQLDKLDLRESDLFYQKLEMEGLYNQYNFEKADRIQTDHLQLEVDFLHRFFLIRAYRMVIEDLDRRTIFGRGFDLPLKEEIIAYGEKHLEELPPVIKGYHLLYRMRSQPDGERNFPLMRELLQGSKGKISRMERINLYTGTLNFGLHRVNTGSEEYLAKVFAMYQEMVNQELMLIEGFIPSWRFRNVVSISLRNHNYEWANHFVDTFEGALENDHQGNLAQYCRGLIQFHQGEFDVAQGHFFRILQDFKDVFYGLNARAYLLQVYYELGDSNGIETLSHSFRMFLSRNKHISDAKRRQYMDFVAHLSRLTNIPLRDRGRLEKLKQEILEKENKGMGSKWLLEKIRELDPKV